LFSGQVDGRQQVLQQLSRLADKGPALPIFVIPWPLADQHDLSIGRAFSGNGVSAHTAKRTQLAGLDLFADVF
jgi:hypothetical protein